MFHRLLSAIFPPKCILCGKILEKDETDLCRTCRVEAPEYSKGKLNVQFLDSFAAVWYYEENVRRSILRYKFYGARQFAPAYGRLLAMRILNDLPRADLITWVPVSRKRLRQRGYDQVELLAQAVSAELGIPAIKTLEKFRDNRANSGLRDPAERRANVLGVYRPVQPEAFRGRRVLLLDDIVTTGATASECARVLLTAGAGEIIFGAVAAGGTTSSKKVQ